jgi:predicted permease
MKWLRRGWQRLRGSLSARETEMSEELAAHLGMLVDENLRRGMSQAEAERAARLSFGGLEAAKESYRDQRGLPWVETLVRDLRYATRGLRKSPGFTAVIVCTLAVAIGANTAVFSLVDQVLLRPRGVSQPERVVTVRTSYAKLKFDFLGASLPTMADLRESPEVYAYVAAIVQAAANYDGGGEPQRLLNASVTANWFHVFGAEPFLGRTFTPSDDQPNVNRVVVLSHDAWVRVFGADHSVVGRTIVLNDVPRQVIGVMPPEFRQPRGVDLWTPSGFTPQMFSGEARFNESGQVVARLREGVSMARAVAWMDVLTRRVHDDPQQGVIARNGIWSISVVPFVDAAVGETKQHLWILFAAVVLVALIACANIAGLMLARSSARAREFSVRVALGASKAQLMRGVFVESCLLAVMGGVAGLVAGQIGMDVLLLLAPPDAAIGLAPQMDRNLLMFSAVAVCGSAVLFGIPSMWWAFRMHGTADLGGGRIVTSGGAKPWGRSVLVVA